MISKPLQLIGRRKSRETQKAERWLKERRIAYHFLDLDMKPLSPGELDSIARSLGGFDILLDRESGFYVKKGYDHLVFDVRTELLEHSDLVKTPLLRRGSHALLGFQEDAWKVFVSGQD